MEFFEETVDTWKLLTIVTQKDFILDVWLGSKYASLS